ncbi:MAG: acetolactate synthase small subunit [Akkermansiaceae bacterium]|jgi:acetolactate synthase-1/3 small subunit|nr:acetolactate synthase small subunit [Akkermansiaceae bacterium]RZN86848.1 MAG: acetolactate synthase small subunit [Verrucomicrobiaceae bacterium]HAN81985.1 acetolactate synthase small subunit [Verrucomicrobiales bacterium]HBI30705.1 acetolactate synthase small subunit [Verrucomicrobiales bacterium]HCQ79226.1 acetolactate synthase small subunit [Verrucomicrobiales bacterium]|tara:strand:- start:6662 stop:7201 length:540 start_codon:yes stop_codon:yes gene_type:complete
MSKTIVTTDTPIDNSTRGASNTLSILVNNSPGVLMRICQVFSRRAYNIDSLVVSEGRTGAFSRMTIDISGNPQGLEQIIKQVNKLIDVIHCFEHTAENSVVREMLLVKIIADKDERSAALQVIEHFAGKTVDMSPNSMIAMFTGTTSKIDAVVLMLGQFEVIETIRTGKVVVARGSQAT